MGPHPLSKNGYFPGKFIKFPILLRQNFQMLGKVSGMRGMSGLLRIAVGSCPLTLIIKTLCLGSLKNIKKLENQSKYRKIGQLQQSISNLYVSIKAFRKSFPRNVLLACWRNCSRNILTN